MIKDRSSVMATDLTRTSIERRADFVNNRLEIWLLSDFIIEQYK